MTGFVALYREATEHPLFAGDVARFGAWSWLVVKACWKSTRFNISGATITLERGQLCVSRSQLATAWGWSPSAVERFLARLQTEQMIERATGQGRSIITICNYEKYQDISEKTGQASGQGTGQRPDSDRTTKEQGNKGTIGEEANASPPSGEREQNALFEDDDEQPPKPAAKPKPKSKGIRTAGVDHPMPDDWRPTLTPAAAKIVDGWPPGMFDREEFAFRGHAEATGRLAKSWDGAFRTWIAKAEERRIENGNRYGSGNRKHAPGHHGGRDNRDGIERALDRQGYGAGPAGRSGTGEGGGSGELPFALPSTLR